VEDFTFKSEVFESAIVIESVITNELKFQELQLSRTYRFEESEPEKEVNAEVEVIDDLNNRYHFSEIEPGKYISDVAFSAEADRAYQLLIKTNEGKTYASKPTKLTSVSKIDKLYASKETSSLGEETIKIFVDSFDPNATSHYYRYQYEETYKIIPPFWSNDELIIVNPKQQFTTKPRVNKNKICYKTVSSNTIIQTQTNGFTEDRVSKFPIRILSRDNFIISYRYSILLKQYVQSLEAYTFYKVLNEQSNSGGLLSQTQPGSINSNVYSIEHVDEIVLGFFEVSSVSSKRLFFNYEDYFPSEPLPPYKEKCIQISPLVSKDGDFPLYETVVAKTHTFYTLNDEPKDGEGPYILVPKVCGDCTELGTTEVPNFWIE